MGRKIAMKKIENLTKCQVTFSKRRSSLMKKANEISVCCDVDVAFVAFSPSGRVSKFSNQKRIEDVLEKYVNLPAEKRLNHMNNIESKLEKLKQLSHINGDHSKLQYLDKQIENLELHIKKCGLELQILETDLRDYELGPDQVPSLHQLSWCERNLNHSLQRVMTRKDVLMMEQLELQNQMQPSYSSILNGNDQASTSANPLPGQIMMQLDPWISPYSARVRENLFQDLLDQGNHTLNDNLGSSSTLDFPIPSNYPIQEPPTIFGSGVMSDVQIPPTFIPEEQQLEENQALLNFNDQINDNAWNNTSSAVFSDSTHMSTPILYNTQDPSFDRSASSITTTMLPDPNRLEIPQSRYDETGTIAQFSNPDLISQFYNMEGQEIGGQYSMDHDGSFANGNLVNNNAELEDHCQINYQMQNQLVNNNAELEGNCQINYQMQNQLVNNNAELEDHCQINCQMQNQLVNNNAELEDHCQINCQMQNQTDAYIVQAPSEAYEDAQCGNLFSKDSNEENTHWTSDVQKTGLWEWDDLLLDENFNFQNVSHDKSSDF